MSKTLSHALTEAKWIADMSRRQVWICDCGGHLECCMGNLSGKIAVARVFGRWDFIIDDPLYLDEMAKR